MKTIPDDKNKSQSYILHKHLFNFINVVETDPQKTPPGTARAYFLFGILVWNAYAVLDRKFPFLDGFVCDRATFSPAATESSKWKIFQILFYVMWNELQSLVYPTMIRLPNPSPRLRMYITRRYQIAVRQYLDKRKFDGSNTTKSFTYANQNLYIEANTGVLQDLNTELVDPDEWTPIKTLLNGRTILQKPLLPYYSEVQNMLTGEEWNRIDSQAAEFYPSPTISDQQIEELVEVCSNLTPEEKMKAEVWAGFEPTRAAPPGKSMILLSLVLASKDYSLRESTALIGGSGICLFHAAVAAWRIKYQYMQARPIQLIRKNYVNQNIVSPDEGTIKNGGFWLPYQPTSGYTPPFPDYVSGHSTFTMAFSTFMNLSLNSDLIPIQGCTIDPVYFHQFSEVFDQMTQPTLFSNLALKPTSSIIVSGTPSIPIELKWLNWSQIAREAGMSRIYGGIHWENSNAGGLAVGQTIASMIMQKLNWSNLGLKF